MQCMGIYNPPPAALPSSAARYAAAIWSMPGAIIEHGADLVIAAWSPGAARIFGYAADEVIGRSLVDLVIRGEDERAWRRLRDAPDAAQVLRGTRKDGAAVACSWRHAPILDDQGRTSGTLCLGQDVTAEMEARARGERSERLLGAVLKTISVIVSEYDREGHFTFHEGKALEAIGLSSGQLVGKNVFDVYGHNPALDSVRAALAGEPSHVIADEHGARWEGWTFPILDSDQQVNGAINVTYGDLDAQRREQELQAKIDLIEQQQKVIRDLAAPIIEVWDGVLTLPIMGVLDSTRTADVMESLLAMVVDKRARFTILDLTGVETVDTKTASYLIQMVRAIRLLGAEGIITGIRPTVAQAMVSLGMDLSGIATEANLRAGLTICMRRIHEERLKAAAAR